VLWRLRWANRKSRGWGGVKRLIWPWYFLRTIPIYAIYLTLLLASFAVQFFYSPFPARDDLDQLQIITVPRMMPSGPLPSEKPVNIGVQTYGDPDSETVIVAIHGSPTVMRDFAVLGPILAEQGCYVIAPEMPGYGQSTPYVPNYGMVSNARYILAVMDEMDIEQAHILGYSIGSGVALWMQNLAPDRVQSLIFYGGIGIQEGEGSGDYVFEHLKYRIGYPLIVILPEMIPHFGLLGPREGRHAFIRNFTDLDQRPLRGILERLNQSLTPMLIVQGHADPMVPPNTARDHHDIVEHSELVVIEGGHGHVFNQKGSNRLAEIIVPFAQRFTDPQIIPSRQTDDTFGRNRAPEYDLPGDLKLTRDMSPWSQMLVIMAGTYILEDPTTVFTGILVSKGLIDPFVALIGIFVGIFSSDLLLYLIGWVFGKRALRWRIVEKRLPAHHVDRLADWFDRHGWTAVLASRFIPGTRLPLYISAGAMGRKPGRFALWTCLAVMIWAPVMLMLVVFLGDAAISPAKQIFGNNLFALLVTLVVILMLIRTMMLLTTKIGRGRLKAFYSRFWRYEFWPAWLFYTPLVPYVLYLMIKHKGISTLTCVNPSIRDSGIVDESKLDILRSLPEQWIIPVGEIDVQDPEQALGQLHGLMSERQWEYPLILKPNHGQRGFAVRKARNDQQALEYFGDVKGQTLAQPYHSGPYEAGIFYYRYPDESKGHIYSITDKEFPIIEGDGKHTLEQLIYRHPRYRMQASLFINRHADRRDEILPRGQAFPLAISGNHCQGTLFCDGSHLITPELEKLVDEISQYFKGFYFGRYDVRYRDVEAFKRGEDLGIVELNGVTAESTNIYDPKRNLLWAYRILYKQWRIAFEIGSANRQAGYRITPLRILIRRVRRHYKTRTKHGRSD